MIQFTVDIPDAMLGYSIPKLILQPLIENAVFHGLEMKGEKGTVVIKAYERGGQAYIIVADDGVGITPEELARLVEGFNVVSETQEQSGWRKIALKNVHQRLRLIYGEEYGLKLSSKLNEGTAAEINFRPVNLGE